MLSSQHRNTEQRIEQYQTPDHPISLYRSARIWDRFADRYAAKSIGDESAYQRKLATTRQYLNQDSMVVELGCGTGSTALAHAPYVKHLTAIDFSRKMIAIAHKKANAAQIDNVEFICREISDIVADDASIDVVLALNVLHVLADWRTTITSVHRMLKPGGVFISSNLCLSDGLTFLKPVAAVGRRVGLMPTLSFFSRSQLERSMADEGFELLHSWQPAPKSATFMVARKTTLQAG